jgi:aldehyde:ferredoxin oxidoreductase
MSDRGGVHLYGPTIDGQNNFAVADTLTVCIRNMRALDVVTVEKALKAATGMSYFSSQEDLDHFAHRIIIFERALNVREGLVPDRDDILPERVFTEPLTLGPRAGTAAAIYDRKKFQEDKQTWYKARGCDEHGIPTKKTLRDLDLAFTIPLLEKTVDLES